MNCKKAQMIINRLIDNEHQPEESFQLEIHLKSCQKCQQYQQNLIRLQKVASIPLNEERIPDLKNTILRKIEEQETLKMSNGFLKIAWTLGLTFLIIFLTALAIPQTKAQTDFKESLNEIISSDYFKTVFSYQQEIEKLEGEVK